MKKLLFITGVLISANLFAQKMNDFLIKNNGDTVYCKIKKFDIYSVKNLTRDSTNSRVVSKLDTSDLKAIVVNGYAFELTPVKENDSLYSHAFLPENNLLQNILVDNSQLGLVKYADANITSYLITLKASGISQVTMATMGVAPIAVGALIATAAKKRTHDEFFIFIKRNQDNEIINLSDPHWSTKDNTDAWVLLKSYLKNSPECIEKIDKYINHKTRVNNDRMLKLIWLYFKNIKLTELDIR